MCISIGNNHQQHSTDNIAGDVDNGHSLDDQQHIADDDDEEYGDGQCALRRGLVCVFRLWYLS